MHKIIEDLINELVARQAPEDEAIEEAKGGKGKARGRSRAGSRGRRTRTRTRARVRRGPQKGYRVKWAGGKAVAFFLDQKIADDFAGQKGRDAEAPEGVEIDEEQEVVEKVPQLPPGIIERESGGHLHPHVDGGKHNHPAMAEGIGKHEHQQATWGAHRHAPGDPLEGMHLDASNGTHDHLLAKGLRPYIGFVAGAHFPVHKWLPGHKRTLIKRVGQEIDFRPSSLTDWIDHAQWDTHSTGSVDIPAHIRAFLDPTVRPWEIMYEFEDGTMRAPTGEDFARELIWFEENTPPGLIKKMKEALDIEFVDRYSALGIPRPDPKTMCQGQCEGTGYVPISTPFPGPGKVTTMASLEEPWRSLWLAAEAKEHSEDGWHFVKCPDCDGVGKRTSEAVWKVTWNGKKKFFPSERRATTYASRYNDARLTKLDRLPDGEMLESKKALMLERVHPVMGHFYRIVDDRYEDLGTEKPEDLPGLARGARWSAVFEDRSAQVYGIDRAEAKAKAQARDIGTFVLGKEIAPGIFKAERKVLEAQEIVNQLLHIRERAPEKLTNERANLRPANPENEGERCRLCKFFRSPDVCTIVEGPVAPDLVCDWIQSRGVKDAPIYKIADENWIAFGLGMIEEQPYQHIVKDVALTPEGPLVLIADTAEPPHLFSLGKEFHIGHTSFEHHWTQDEVDRLVGIGKKLSEAREAENVSGLSNRELIELHAKLHDVYTKGGGAPGIVPRHINVVRELTRRGLEHRPKDQLDEITLAQTTPEVLLGNIVKAFETTIVLRKPFLAVVGSVAVDGKGKDLDIWVNWPAEDKEFLRVLAFRIKSMLPPDYNVQLLADHMGPFTNFMPIADLEVRFIPPDQREIQQMSEGARDCMPRAAAMRARKRTPTTYPVGFYRIFHHMRGKSVHKDFRFVAKSGSGGHLEGWTITDQPAGAVKREPIPGGKEKTELTRAEVSQGIKKAYDIQTRVKWKFRPNMKVGDKVNAVKKKRQPLKWMNVFNVAFAPGVVGASPEEVGVFTLCDEGKLVLGVQKPDFNEYFLDGKVFKGRIGFRLVSTKDFDKPTDEGVQWQVSTNLKDQTPNILSVRERRRDRKEQYVPKQGEKAIPPEWEKLIKPAHRWWQGGATAKDRIRRLNLAFNDLAEREITKARLLKLTDKGDRIKESKRYFFSTIDANKNVSKKGLGFDND